MKKTFMLLSLVLLAFSCETSGPSVPDSRRVDIKGISHDMIELGEQLRDPYSVEVINEALQSLYPTRASRTDVRPTDMYVRFLPKDEDELAVLEGLGLVLIDHPLDRRILKEGDYYHDPSLPTNSITWQYAVVQTGFVFPDGIQYEILDECYIAENAATRASDVDWEAVEREAYRLTGNLDMLLPATRDGEQAQSFAPSGKICISDPDSKDGQPEGVKGVAVSVNSFVKFAFAYTEEDGSFKMTRSYSTDVRYRLIFKNKKGFGIGVNMFLVPASVSTLGEHSPEGLEVVIDSDSERKLFSRCVVNNAAWDYYTRCKAEGSNVSAPPANLRMWILQFLPSGLSPMLHQGAVVDSPLVKNYLEEYTELIKLFMPDVFLGLRDKYDYASIYAATLHALAHSSHFLKVGRAWWENYLTFVLKSVVADFGITYGAGTEQYAGYCEVAEMWSYFFENVIYRERYGADAPVEGTTHWFSPQILLYLEERGLGPNKIFSALGSDVKSIEEFRTRLCNLYPEHLSLINQAFERYEN